MVRAKGCRVSLGARVSVPPQVEVVVTTWEVRWGGEQRGIRKLWVDARRDEEKRGNKKFEISKFVAG